MKFTTVSDLTSRHPADILILPFYQKSGKATPAARIEEFNHLYSSPLDIKDFTAKEGETLILYCDEKREKRIALLGLGEAKELNVEVLRRAYGAATSGCLAKKIASVNIVIPTSKALKNKDLLRGLLEGLLLVNYAFSKYKSESPAKGPQKLLEKVNFVSSISAAEVLEEAHKALKICEGVYLARNLVNGNADEITPQYLATVAKNLAKKLPHTQAKILDAKELAKEKMGLLLAVGRGSACEPLLIQLSYHGNPKSKETIVLIGKGVTYDTGGLNMKPTGSIETMKCDMGGAATALGTLQAAAELGLKINLTVIIPSTENAVSGTSYKPGDVYISHSGKSVEIGNTDAEGRLILADAISYAIKKLKPALMIDFATLTGAIDVALGPEASGLFSNNEDLAKQLLKAGDETFERLWQLPLFPEYREKLKSDIADIKNIGGRPAGSITAAMFLKEFVGETPWAHLDIASTAYLNEAKRYQPKAATGVGVRLMAQFLGHLAR